MTSNELIAHFNRVYGIEKEWPKTYEVDAHTYANCCQAAFEWSIDESRDVIFYTNTITQKTSHISFRLDVGPNKGLMFKGVELILKS